MKLGHVHLKVRNLQRSVEFYRHHLGLQITEQVGDAFTFLSAGLWQGIERPLDTGQLDQSE